MKKLFTDTRILDRACIDSYDLTEDIMMENAAMALESVVRKKCSDDSSVLIVTGSGNNGGDGMVLARRLHPSVEVSVFCIKQPKSPCCILQFERAKKAGIHFIGKEEFDGKLLTATVLVDCIYGSGFHGSFDEETLFAVQKMNGSSAYRIACDIPSGIDSHGIIASCDVDGNPIACKVNETITMGALKTALYSDAAKDFCASIVCAPLGIDRTLFESSSKGARPEAYLLEKDDLHLPNRCRKSVNKGSFGHTAIVCGEKSGAAVIAGSAATAFGSGLVTLVHSCRHDLEQEKSGKLPVYCPMDLMQSDRFPENTTAVALGMGLGTGSTADTFIDSFTEWFGNHGNVRCVLDADLFRSKKIENLLATFASSESCKRLILTPHPKEFQSLLKICGLGDYSIQSIVDDRIELSKQFVKKYPGLILLVKGANVCITQMEERLSEVQSFINAFGSPCLAKGGSGDVLSGLIASLLAQNYTAFDAVVSASLAHALASCEVEVDYAMTPSVLIEKIRGLKREELNRNV